MLGCEIVEKSKIAFRARAPGRRNPHSSSSPGKPDTWQRGVGDPMAGTWRDAKCKLPRRSSPSTENVADTEKVQVHHIRKLSDLKVKGQSGTDQGFGVSLEHEDGDTRGGRGRCWEMSAYTSAARHAAKCAESGRTRNVA